MKRLELHPAYVWDCDECGTENFARAVVPNISPSELAKLKDEHGIQPWEEGEFMLAPNQVTCSKCGGIWETTRDDPDDDPDWAWDESS